MIDLGQGYYLAEIGIEFELYHRRCLGLVRIQSAVAGFYMGSDGLIIGECQCGHIVPVDVQRKFKFIRESQ